MHFLSCPTSTSFVLCKGLDSERRVSVGAPVGEQVHAIPCFGVFLVFLRIVLTNVVEENEDMTRFSRKDAVQYFSVNVSGNSVQPNTDHCLLSVEFRLCH